LKDSEAQLISELFEIGISYEELVEKFPQFSEREIMFAIGGHTGVRTDDCYPDEPFTNAQEDYVYPTEPAHSEPGYSEAGYSELGYSAPGCSEPAYSESAFSEPAYSEPAYSEPAYSEPAYSEPVGESSEYPRPARPLTGPLPMELENSRIFIGDAAYYRTLNVWDDGENGVSVQLPGEAVAFVQRRCLDDRRHRFIITDQYDLDDSADIPDWYRYTVILGIEGISPDEIGEWIGCEDNLELERVKSFRLIYNDGVKNFGIQFKKSGTEMSLCYVADGKPGKVVLPDKNLFAEDVLSCGIRNWSPSYNSGDSDPLVWKLEASIDEDEYKSEGRGCYPEGMETLAWLLDKVWKIPIGEL